jgi:Protein of unknown function (DUF2442)
MKEIIQALPLENNFLNVRFRSGENFEIDMKPFIKSGVSSALRDKAFFDSVRVEDGYITWPNGYDFCPEFLFEYATNNHK